MLSSLPLHDNASDAGYSRDQFGQSWSEDVTVDSGHNGCDTRNDILQRDLTGSQIKPGTHGCVVLAGTLADPYTAQSIAFIRGQGTSDDVQIDHVLSGVAAGVADIGAARNVSDMSLTVAS